VIAATYRVRAIVATTAAPNSAAAVARPLASASAIGIDGRKTAASAPRDATAGTNHAAVRQPAAATRSRSGSPSALAPRELPTTSPIERVVGTVATRTPLEAFRATPATSAAPVRTAVR